MATKTDSGAFSIEELENIADDISKQVEVIKAQLVGDICNEIVKERLPEGETQEQLMARIKEFLEYQNLLKYAQENDLIDL